MATIKNFTSLEQSKILAKILPVESADAFYPWRELMKDYDSIYVPEKMLMSDIEQDDILAWSLAALLDILPRVDIEKEICSDDTYDYRVKAYIGDGYIGDWYDNPVDACVAMIVKLKELNLL